MVLACPLVQDGPESGDAAQTATAAQGLLQAFGNYFLVSFSSMLVFALMIVVLLLAALVANSVGYSPPG